MPVRVSGLHVLVAALLAGLPPVPVLAAGDSARGRAVAEQCASCHGAEGISPSPELPILAGQHEIYLINALRAYRSGVRDDGVMDAPVHDLSDEDIDAVAAFLAGRKGLGTEGGAPVVAAPLPSATPTLAGCPVNNSSIPATQDSDRDGLPDRQDAAPADASEFVRDADGDGWYEICDIRQLQAIQTLGSGLGNATGLDLPARLARRYHVVRDLDASLVENFEPIGNCGPENDCAAAADTWGFSGSLHGGGHVIRKLRIARPDVAGVGLIGVLASHGTLRGLRLDDAVVSGREQVGALAGVNFGLIAGCRGRVQVSGRNAVGGLVGEHAGRIVGCGVSGSVNGTDAVGGLVGDMHGMVARSHADIRVSGRRGVGGLAGVVRFATLQSSHASGKVSGEDEVGGLAGSATEALLTNSFADAAVEATGRNAGGVAGSNVKGRVYNSYARGAVRGSQRVGGLVGANHGDIRNSYATGKVSGRSRLGGLVGDNSGGRVRASYWDLGSSDRVFGAGNDDDSSEGADNNEVDPGEVNRLAIYGKSRAALRVMAAAETGWHPSAQPAEADAGLYYCDADADGTVQEDERAAENLAWDFAGSALLPGLRCIEGGIGVQPLH